LGRRAIASPPGRAGDLATLGAVVQGSADVAGIKRPEHMAVRHPAVWRSRGLGQGRFGAVFKAKALDPAVALS